jgi:hypothetical protein
MMELHKVKLQVRRDLFAGTMLCVLSAAATAHPAPAESPPAPTPGPSRTQPAPPPSKEPAVKPSEAPAGPSLVGLNVFSADGTRVGEVRSVSTDPHGDVAALHIRTGGFLGFGGRVVAVPQGRFIRSGQSIRLDLDAEEVNGLPEVED